MSLVAVIIKAPTNGPNRKPAAHEKEYLPMALVLSSALVRSATRASMQGHMKAYATPLKALIRMMSITFEA